jgi:acetyl-CoA carboxylase carboxyl transferase subunit alpha
MEYLDFELPIKELEEQLEKCQLIGEESDVDVTETCMQIEKKLAATRKEIYKNLTAWQRVQLSRHPNRPYTLDYIRAICGDTFLELHGDRTVRDDKAMIGGLGKIGDQSYMFIGQQKGYNTKTRQYRNFGMANPEGYRKALRLMKSAEKFEIPVVAFVDTPGAYPGIEAEERGQGEAIARNILEMTRLKVPIIVVIIGEGASGGALGIGDARTGGRAVHAGGPVGDERADGVLRALTVGVQRLAQTEGVSRDHQALSPGIEVPDLLGPGLGGDDAG